MQEAAKKRIFWRNCSTNVIDYKPSPKISHMQSVGKPLQGGSMGHPAPLKRPIYVGLHGFNVTSSAEGMLGNKRFQS